MRLTSAQHHTVPGEPVKEMEIYGNFPVGLDVPEPEPPFDTRGAYMLFWKPISDPRARLR